MLLAIGLSLSLCDGEQRRPPLALADGGGEPLYEPHRHGS